MTPAPFKLPLNPTAFAAALEKGHGRALMHAREFGLAGVEDSFINACLFDQTYDPQSEGPRVGWLLEIADAAGGAVPLGRVLLPRFDSPTDRLDDVTQRCGIARELARRGCADARNYLYASLRKWPESSHLVGEEDIIELDGPAGLVHVVEFSSALADRDPDFWLNDSPIRCFDERHGSGAGRVVLDAAASRSSAVAGFLERIDGRRKRLAAVADAESVEAEHQARVARTKAIPASQVIQEIESGGPPRISWSIHAPKSALAAVFEAMLRQEDTLRLRRYLRMFLKAALAEFDPRLLGLTEHEDAEVRRLAHRALSHYAHAEVRRLALARLSAGRWLEDELQLLKLNYQAGDAALVEHLFEGPKNRDQLHGLVSDLVDVFEANPLPQSSPFMLFVYEQSPCTYCRRHAVKVLMNTQTAPAWLLEECRHDSSPGTRELVANPLTE